MKRRALKITPRNVNEVADGLKRIEGNPDGQDDVLEFKITPRNGCPVLEEKVRVLEVEQERKTEENPTA
jgi:hypothetical protein